MNCKCKSQTMEEVIDTTLERIDTDIRVMNSKRDHALSMFRSAADSLAEVNENLNQECKHLESLEKYAEEQRLTALKTIEENARVRERILEIIGE